MHTIKPLTSFACLLLHAICFAQTDTIKFKIDSIAKQFLSNPQTASIVVGIYRQGSTTPEIYPYGVVNKQTKQPADATTIYKLGSVGKTFTATTLAWYAINQPQVVQLNDPINKFFPATQQLPFWVSNTGDTINISLLNLAMHYSGLPDSQPNHIGPPNYTVARLLDFLGSDNPKWHVRPLSVQPGTKWIYSNTGFGLLGVIMERISGLAYQQLLDSIFVNELNMPDTRIQLNQSQRARLATGYQNGDTVKYLLTSPAFYGAGGNFSCMNDMMKYLAWNMGLTNSKLNNLLDTLHAIRDTTTRSTAWQGLAWQTSLLPGTQQKFVWKDGSTAGYASFICFVPAKKIGVMVLSNSSGLPFDRIGIQILKILNSY